MDAALAGFLGSKIGVIENQLGRVQTARGWAGAVFDGCRLEDGRKIALGGFGTNVSILLPSTTYGSGSAKFGILIVPKVNLSGIECMLSRKSSEERTAYLVRHSDGVEIARVSIKSSIFCVFAPMEAGVAYRVVTDANGDNRIYERFPNPPFPYMSTDVHITSGVLNDTSVTDNAYTISSVRAIKRGGVTGTATLDISPSSLYAWGNLYFKTKKPENTDIVCTVKDDSDNVLIPSISDGVDLSSIDPTQYETLRLVWTLTRDSVEDESPVVYEPSWAWLGGSSSVFDLSEKTPTFIRFQTNSSALQTVVDVEGGSGVAVVAVRSSDTQTRNARVVITVDDKILDDTNDNSLAYGSNGIMAYGVGGFSDGGILDLGNYGIVSTADIGLPIVPTIGFKKSFKVEASTNSGQNIKVRVVVLA
jgi:hypothetical protein